MEGFWDKATTKTSTSASSSTSTTTTKMITTAKISQFLLTKFRLNFGDFWLHKKEKIGKNGLSFKKN